MTAAVETLAGAQARRDWRLWLGMTITFFWLALGSTYILEVIGWDRFVDLPASGMGGFLEGAFAPLAFLWLVIGFFLQQRELTQNTDAIRAQYDVMRKAADHAEIQAAAIRDNALHQKQETFLMVADRVHEQLGAVTGLLWMSSQYSGDDPEVTPEFVSELWARLGSGDPQAFSRQFLNLHFQTRGRGESPWGLYFGTEVRTRHSQTIISTWERLMGSIGDCDPDGVITDALMGSGHGTLYRLIVEQRDASPPNGRVS